MRVLLTGGAGYIGSHTAVVLCERGHSVTILDDFSNSSPEAISRVEEITGCPIPYVRVDLADRTALHAAMNELEQGGERFDAVIHFAGLKAVGESVQEPSRYYRVNINSTINLLDEMRERGIHKLVFSSSATVYGNPQYLPLDEQHQTGVKLTNPYGWTKAMIEQIIRDEQVRHSEMFAVLLRYFNPVGAHPSGRIGEDPSGIPNNLMPFVSQVAVGKRPHLNVFGNTYPTPDGTGVRDYIHVMDLAEGHVAALEEISEAGVYEYNLGSGTGSSVLELVQTFESETGQRIPYQIVQARPGDVAEMVADPRKANAELHWKTTRSLAEACADSWNWQSQNPNGYEN